MRLILEDPNHILKDDFLNYLLKEMRSYLLTTINWDKLIHLQEYVNTSNLFRDNQSKPINLHNSIWVILGNLIYRRIAGEIDIEVNPNLYVYNSSIKVETLFKFIDQGNSEVKGYPIFSKTFTYFGENISHYLHEYLGA